MFFLYWPSIIQILFFIVDSIFNFGFFSSLVSLVLILILWSIFRSVVFWFKFPDRNEFLFCAILKVYLYRNWEMFGNEVYSLFLLHFGHIWVFELCHPEVEVFLVPQLDYPFPATLVHWMKMSHLWVSKKYYLNIYSLHFSKLGEAHIIIKYHNVALYFREFSTKNISSFSLIFLILNIFRVPPRIFWM